MHAVFGVLCVLLKLMFELNNYFPGCLKRAEELEAIEKKEDALIMLNESLRQFRRTWTQATEDLVVKHLDLCVDLRNTRLAKDCIIQSGG